MQKRILPEGLGKIKDKILISKKPISLLIVSN